MTRKVLKKTKEERYLERVFYLLHQNDILRYADKKSCFNQTELRLLGEIASAKSKGERYISTQLATLLGLTRSAISQIVNNLEKKKVVKRVADEVDKKIAYIELTDDFFDTYGEQLHNTSRLVFSIIQEFWEARFETLCDELEIFLEVAKIKLKR